MDKKSSRLKNIKTIREERKKQAASQKREKRRFRLDAYYKIVGSVTLFVMVLYIILQNLKNSGYELISGGTVYWWVYYAMIVGIIMLLGRFVASLPRHAATAKMVRTFAIILSVVSIVMMFFLVQGRVRDEWKVCATLDSPGGEKTVLVQRRDLEIEGAEESAAKIYTMYKAQIKLNPFFAWNKASEDNIILLDDPDAELRREWLGDKLVLTTHGNAVDGMDTISVPLD